MLQGIPKTCKMLVYYMSYICQMYTLDMTKNKALVGPAIKIIAKLQICQFPKSSHNSKNI